MAHSVTLPAVSTHTGDRATTGSLSFNNGLGVAAVAAAVVCGGVWYLSSVFSWRQGALLLVGAGAGVVLYHAAFGFTSAWRAFIANGRGDAVRAQMLMLAVTCVVFFPLLARGEVFGEPVRGSLAPISVSVVVGAFLFGIGMQLGGGCASGTLYSAGGGSLRMFVTLAAFITGSVLGVWHTTFWDNAPGFEAVSLIGRFGFVMALAISLGLFAVVAWLTVIVEKASAARGALDRSARTYNVLRGPWPLVAGAFGLAAVNIATLVLAGRPWGVTAAFALWGSKALQAAGVNVAAWPYWQPRADVLQGSVLADITSVMDFGIMLGALGAAGLAGRFAPTWRVPARSLLAAVVGGLMLGYGARIAYGCNIGAFFSGVASSSLHGWLWFVAAFAGNVLGTRLRPWFRLSVS